MKKVKVPVAFILSVLLLTQCITAAVAAPPGPPPPGGGGGTPPGGSTTTTAVSLLINQVYGGGSSASSDLSNSFIELFNDSGDSIDLSGYTLSYSVDSSGTLNTVTLDLTGTVPAYNSFLIRCGATGNASATHSIDTYDLSWNQEISTTDYQIVISDDSANTTDAIAVGSSVLYTEAEGNAAAAVRISDTTALRRADFKDTDDNATDFEAVDYSTADYAVYGPHSTDDGMWTILKDFVMNIGSTEGSVSVTWFSTTADSNGSFQILESASFNEASAVSYTADTTLSEAENADGFYCNKVSLTGLNGNSTYTYRYGNDGVWSDVDTYETPDYSSDAYSFVVVGDPQLGASGDAESDADGWYNTLRTALSDGTDYGFIFSMGDQVETSTSEVQYNLFLDTDSLRGIPMATTVGNHDSGAVDYVEHFTLPNVSSEYGETVTGNGDYYYTYGSTLFMVLNTNNSSVAEHETFMKETIQQNPDATWKVVVFHQSIYSVASHVSDVASLRTNLSPILNDLDIDVVLQGHDHVYARTYVMGGSDDETGMAAQVTAADQISNDTSSGQTNIINPDGVQYVTFNSGSGSKFYNITSEAFQYSDVMNQSKLPNYSSVSVTDTSFTVTTYKVNPDNTTSQVDTFTLYKFDSAYANGYTTNYLSDTLSIDADGTRSLLLTSDASGLSPTTNAALSAAKANAYLTALPDDATNITVDVSSGIYYAKLEIYDAAGERCGGSLGWTSPGGSLTADLTSATYADAKYYTVVVKNGNAGTSAITEDPADYIAVSVAERDSHVSYGKKTDATYGEYSYVSVSGLTPSVYMPTGAGSNASSDFTNVLGMAEKYGDEENIVVAANAGIFYNNSNNTYCFNYKEADGVVISDGVVLKSTETIDHTQCDIFVIDEYGNVGWAPYYADADGLVAGTETWYNIYGTEIDGIVSSDNTDTTTYGKIVSAVTGFVPILVNGTVLSSYDNYVGHYTQSAVRQIFGVKADGTYLLLSGTWTMASAAAAALAEGCVFAYNFDGGGSAETVIGETVSSIGNNVDANSYSAVDFVEQSKGTRTLPTFMVFTSSDKVVSSATPASVSAVCSKTSYTSGIEIDDLFQYLTVTENFINANGNTSSRTIYSAQGVDKTVTLTNVVIGGASAVAACTEKTSGTAPNGTLYHTKSESEISSSLSSNSNTRESENYYDYSRGYTISTADDLTTSGSKTITVSYVPGDGLGALTTTFSISITTETNSTSAATGNTSAASGSNCKIDGSHATINADVTDGKASFTVGSNVVSTLINNAQKTKNVLIEADAGSRAPLSVGVTIAASDVAAIASASDMALSIDTGIATISLGSAALTRMSGHALTVTAITNDDGTVTINVAADGDTQNAVSGGIHIAIPVESVSSTQVIVLVNEDGSETVLPKSMLDDEGNMAVTLIGSATIKITDNAKTFNDVIADNWSADSIAFVSSHELFNGVGNGIFERTATMNRGMLMTVLYRLEGQPDTAGSDVSFDDVPSDAFYADAVKWGVKMGIIKGTDDGFNAESAITRQDLAVFLYRYAGTQGISSTDISGYSDVADVADYAQNALSWAVANGIINGTGAGLAPTGSATREQVAAMMTRLVQNVINN